MQPCLVSVDLSLGRMTNMEYIRINTVDERKCTVLCGAVKNKARTHMEFDLQSLFGLLCKAVLIG
jgi:hypothetical protein